MSPIRRSHHVHRTRSAIVTCLTLATFATSCIAKDKYDAKVAELEQTKAELEAARQTGERQQRDTSDLKQRLENAQTALRSSQQSNADSLAKLKEVDERATELERLATDRQGVVSELEAQLTQQRALLEEFRTIAEEYGVDSPQELQRALAELQKRVSETEAALRFAAMELERERRIAKKLKALIDAGTLRVRRRAGRLVIELPGDVHFDAGSAKLTEVGRSTLEQLAPVLQAERDRLFVVEGHTDNQPIKVSGFRSNWHLGSNRAEVARQAMVEAGLEANHVAIASWADVLPVCAEVDEAECRKRNRRVEVLLLPRFE